MDFCNGKQPNAGDRTAGGDVVPVIIHSRRNFFSGIHIFCMAHRNRIVDTGGDFAAAAADYAAAIGGCGGDGHTPTADRLIRFRNLLAQILLLQFLLLRILQLLPVQFHRFLPQ